MASRKPCTTIRGALARSVEDARRAGRMTPAAEVQALIALRFAGAADRAEDLGEFSRAVDRLGVVLSELPLEPERVTVRTLSGESFTHEIDPRRRVVELLDRGPQVGDAAHA